jgi:hypothetical protein
MTRFFHLVGLSVLALGATHCGVPEVGSMYAAGVATAETPERHQIAGPGKYLALDMAGNDTQITSYIDPDFALSPAGTYLGGVGPSKDVPLVAISVGSREDRVDYTAIAETTEAKVQIDAHGQRVLEIVTEIESNDRKWRYVRATFTEQPSSPSKRDYWVEYEFN